MNHYPFIRRGIGVYPNNLTGLFITWIAAAYNGFLFLQIDMGQHSVSDTLINFIPRTIAVIAIWYFVALVLSKKTTQRM